MLVKTAQKRESEVADSPPPEDGEEEEDPVGARKGSRKEGCCSQESGVCSPPKKSVGNDLMSMLDQITAFAAFSMSSR